MLTAESGSYALSGTEASFLFGRSVSLEPGSYTYTGTAANLVWSGQVGFTLVAGSGTYAVTGGAAEEIVLSRSVYYAILTAVHEAVQSISFNPIANENIQVVKVLNERETVLPGLPGILILPFGAENITATAGTNERDDIGYPVAIVAFDQDRQQSRTGEPADAQEGTQDQTYNFNNRLLWRQKIRKQFINQRLSLSGVNTEVNRCTVEPWDVVRAEDWLTSNIWVSGMVFRFWTRETRGN
jgi:hypothetical protein